MIGQAWRNKRTGFYWLQVRGYIDGRYQVREYTRPPSGRAWWFAGAWESDADARNGAHINL